MIMLHYIFDGSFEGMLTAIYEAYYSGSSPDGIYEDNNYQQSLEATVYIVETNAEKARKVFDSIKYKISEQALKTVYYTFLSELNEAPTCIYQYLRLGYKLGARIDGYLQNDWVRKTEFIKQKVFSENHLMLGLLRFELLDNGIYYAGYNPTYNITALLAVHFKDRLADQHWIIHDTRRGVCAVYDKHEWILTYITDDFKVTLCEKELLFQELWKRFYKAICIEERKNHRLRKQHMPVRYWKYLSELK